MAARVEIVTIGDELLLGFTLDSNGAHLARELAAVGITVVRRTTVSDDAEAIAAAVREALDRTGAAITTGGLGPTADDLTKASVAALFGRALRLDEAHAAWMRERWRSRFGRDMPEANLQQAMMPAGARKLANRHGSAPGVWLEDEHGRWVAMLPGVPREMRGMLGDELLPLLRERARGREARVVRSRTLRTTGIAESAIADRVGELARGFAGVSLAYLPGPEGTDLRLTVRDATPGDADRLLAAGAARLSERLAAFIYGEGEEDLASVVLDRCRALGRRIALAESCTGGLLGARLTAIPGSSDVLAGGIIAYSNEVKREHLGVSEDLLRAHGAVSEPVVRAMAAAACDRFGTAIGIAITGIAGPSGGTAEKPVGTVWIATDVDGAVESTRTIFIGDRDEIRRRAAQGALDLLRRRLAGLDA